MFLEMSDEFLNTNIDIGNQNSKNIQNDEQLHMKTLSRKV